MMELFGPYRFSVLDVENLRLHYARTLQHWLSRYDAIRDYVLETYDPVFWRTWRFYLASSQASFATGQLQLFQVLFSRRGCNDLPWTRAHLYSG
jgi:cyclopropane-fatty-acyl-phospholipid synthase